MSRAGEKKDAEKRKRHDHFRERKRVVDLWLPSLTCSDVQLHPDYTCIPWWAWKRSVPAIRSHLCSGAPAADEADIILQNSSHSLHRFQIQLFPRGGRLDIFPSAGHASHVKQTNVKKPGSGIFFLFQKGKSFPLISMQRKHPRSGLGN